MASEYVTTLENAAEPALDLHVLAQLAAIGRNGRSDFMDRIITLFLLTAPRLVKELEVASEAVEIAALHRASHSLKPCSATVGALSLARLCETLETMARSGSVPDPTARVAAIAREYKRVEAAPIGAR